MDNFFNNFRWLHSVNSIIHSRITMQKAAVPSISTAYTQISMNEFNIKFTISQTQYRQLLFTFFPANVNMPTTVIHSEWMCISEQFSWVNDSTTQSNTLISLLNKFLELNGWVNNSIIHLSFMSS